VRKSTSTTSDETSKNERRFLFVPSDETILLTVLLVALLCVGGWFVQHGDADPDSAVAHPQVRQQAAPPSSPPVRNPANFQVNINTATTEELVAIPEIGPKRAALILAYRQEFGPFRSLDELVRVKGIGEKTLAKIKPFLLPFSEKIPNPKEQNNGSF